MEDTVGIFRVERFDRVSSTNNLVKRAIDDGRPSNLAITARVQEAGYGRQGRNWKSPEGGMYVSMLLRPSVDQQILPTLSLVVALAVRRAVLEMPIQNPSSIKVKWPNDVVVEDDSSQSAVPAIRKLCGISLEQRKGALCVGVGINVFKPEGSGHRVAGKNSPAFLEDLAMCRSSKVSTSENDSLKWDAFEGTEFEDASLNRSSAPSKLTRRVWSRDASSWPNCRQMENDGLNIDAVRNAFLERFSEMYEAWCTEGFSIFLDEYRSCSFLMGKCVSITDLNGHKMAEGEVAGVTPLGHLLICGKDGESHEIVSGEAHIESIYHQGIC